MSLTNHGDDAAGRAKAAPLANGIDGANAAGDGRATGGRRLAGVSGAFGAADEAARRTAESSAERLRQLWTEARARARTAPAGSPAFARMADLAAAYAAMAVRAGRRDRARAVAGDALASLRDACRADEKDVARHLAFSRTLELAAACEAAEGNPRAAFDALRAAVLAVTPFAPLLRLPGTPAITRIALAESLIRPITAAANMLEEPAQRRGALAQVWHEATGWAQAATGAADHPSAVEMAVIAAFDLAVAEADDSAGACLERCEELRPHLDALAAVRGEDAVVRTHRAAFARLCADAWQRLGDHAEAARLLDEAQAHLHAAEHAEGADTRELQRQRAALAAQRAPVDAARAGATMAAARGR